MTPADALRLHAASVSAAQLARTRGALSRLEPGDRRAVEELADAVARATAGCLLDSASREPSLAAALAAIYESAGPEPG